MWSTGTLILFCLISFVLGEGAGIFIIALLSANEEDNNGDK